MEPRMDLLCVKTVVASVLVNLLQSTASAAAVTVHHLVALVLGIRIAVRVGVMIPIFSATKQSKSSYCFGLLMRASRSEAL